MASTSNRRGQQQQQWRPVSTTDESYSSSSNLGERRVEDEEAVVTTAKGSSDSDHGTQNSSSSSSSSSNECDNHQSSSSVVSPAVHLYAACAALNSVNLGYDLGVSTNAGPLLQTDFDLTNTQLEMFLGCLNFFSIFGALVSPLITDHYGRRVSFITAAIGFIAGIAIMVTSSSFHTLLSGRLLVGLSVGVGEAIDPMYIAEIAPSHIRGELVSWAEAGVALGVVLGFCSSLVTQNWRIMLSLGAILPLVMIGLVLYVMPESPRWLLSKQQEMAARVILAKLYPEDHHHHHHHPLDEQQLQQHYDNNNDNDNDGNNQRCNQRQPYTCMVDQVVQDIQESLALEQAAAHTVGWGMILRPSPAVRRMLLVGVGIAIIQQACGIDSIMFYLMFIIQDSGVTSPNAQLAALIVLGMVKLLFVFVGAKLFDKYGRRPLLFVSLLGCAGSLLIVSISIASDTDVSETVTIFALALYLAFFSSGLGPGNWVIVSEVFATSIRAKAMSVAVFPNRVTATIMASTFLSMAELLTWPGFFLLLALICFASAFFLYLYLPETKGRTLESMAHYFAEVTGDRSILDMEETLNKIRRSKGAEEEEIEMIEDNDHDREDNVTVGSESEGILT